MIKFHCPKCGRKVGFKVGIPGKQVTCPNCKRTVTIPKSATGISARTGPDAGGRAGESREPVGRETPPAGSSGAAPAAAVAVAKPHNPQQSRAAHRPPHLTIPDYKGVKFLGGLFWAVGILHWVMAAIVAVGTIVGAISQGSRPPQPVEQTGFQWQGPDLWQLLMGLAVAVLIMVLGFILVGFGQLFFCIRDQTRNSFYLRRLQNP